MRHEGEPSVENILQSIKRVMARERPAGGVASGGGPVSTKRDFAPTSAEQAPPEPADPYEAEELRETADPVAMPLPPVDYDTLDEQPEPDDLIENEADAEAELSPEPAPDFHPEPAPEPSAEPLTGEATAAAVREQLAALAAMTGPDDATPLQSMARAMLRPLLAQWLDEHLPAIVEREVRAEIARITHPRVNGD